MAGLGDVGNAIRKVARQVGADTQTATQRVAQRQVNPQPRQPRQPRQLDQSSSKPWAGANMTPQSPTRKRSTIVIPPKRAASLARDRKKMSATVGSQGPDRATVQYGQRMAKKWSKQLGKPYDPTYRPTTTPTGGTRYKLVGPNGKTYTTPLEA